MIEKLNKYKSVMTSNKKKITVYSNAVIMGTLVPISSSCFVFSLGVFLMWRNASVLSSDMPPSKYRTTILLIILAFLLILLSGVVNKVLE